MPLNHYLEHYDDSESASCVSEIKQEGYTPRAFLITGMCRNCQCDVFRKEPPEDTFRWEQGGKQ